MKKICYVLILTLILAIFTGCGEADIERVEEDREKEQEEQEQAAEELEEELDDVDEEVMDEEEVEDEVDLAVGDSVRFNDIIITLNDVTFSEGSDWETPNEAAYLIADFSVENDSDESYNVSSMLNFSVYDDEHFKHSITIFTDTKGSMDGEVAPGRTMRGEIAFDVPDSSYYEVVFEEPFTNGQAIWYVGS
ncbi:DUF4352 domain-containing protein [Evansella sp. AB-P1]|uniref:DUF4352 domain-containing protein n=1 Tax=Evansella sp. AB-P1 TaxID=3037653 RepID=UPI00241D0311|nr:DUF4352 domain-containing protein [Evansella sp. AB-P1]MDG5789837.1 DUF4352 domain-containing protein [Evansella sp. AB-P1]